MNRGEALRAILEKRKSAESVARTAEDPEPAAKKQKHAAAKKKHKEPPKASSSAPPAKDEGSAKNPEPATVAAEPSTSVKEVPIDFNCHPPLHHCPNWGLMTNEAVCDHAGLARTFLKRAPVPEDLRTFNQTYKSEDAGLVYAKTWYDNMLAGRRLLIVNEKLSGELEKRGSEVLDLKDALAANNSDLETVRAELSEERKVRDEWQMKFATSESRLLAMEAELKKKDEELSRKDEELRSQSLKIYEQAFEVAQVLLSEARPDLKEQASDILDLGKAAEVADRLDAGPVPEEPELPAE